VVSVKNGINVKKEKEKDFNWIKITLLAVYPLRLDP
jgi:hypothetical protein